jgi:hypothetical protein
MPEFAGLCACGTVRFASPGPLLWAGFCHCESCRRATSSPITAFFGVPRKTLSWIGDPSIRVSSSGKVRRLFCGDCGSQLSYQSDRWPDEAHLYAATLESPQPFAPQAHFHWSERLPWLRLDDSLPKIAASADDSSSS